MGRVAAESLSAVLALAVLLAALQWVAHRQPGTRTGPTPKAGLVGEPPTDMPTFTPRPKGTGTSLPPTVPTVTAAPLPAVITHTVVSRDTLYGIAGRYGVPVDAIVALNPELQENPHRLSIGQRLRVPVTHRTADRGSVVTPALAISGRATQVAFVVTVTATSASQVVTAVPPMATHAVAAGETITEVAQAYQMTVDELVAANPQLDSRPALLPPGETLFVRAPSALTSTLGITGRLSAGAGLRAPGAAQLPPEDVGSAVYPAPLLLAPADGAVVTGGTPLLQWLSVGVLPLGVSYVVALRNADATDSPPRLIWVPSNATAIRVPADFRPAIGSRARIAWSVSIRRLGGRLFGADAGTRLSAPETWRTFTWAP